MADSAGDSATTPCNLTTFECLFTIPNSENVTQLQDALSCKYPVFDIVVNIVLVCVLCCLGILGNMISLIILNADKKNKPAVLVLQALALSDSLFLLISFVVVGLIMGVFPNLTSLDVSACKPYILKYVNPLGYMTQTAIVWFTLTLAVNRYLAVCKPFRAPRWLTVRNTKIEITAVAIVSILFNFPRIFQLDVVYDDHGNAETVKQSSIGPWTAFGKVYTDGLYSLLVLILPMILIVALNVLLILDLRSARHKRRRSISGVFTKVDQNITRVMVAIIAVFVICHTPDRILQMMTTYKLIEIGQCDAGYYFSSNISNVLVIFNSSVNFVIYYLLRPRFRQELIERCAPCMVPRGVSLSDNGEAYPSLGSANTDNGQLTQAMEAY